MNLTDTIQKRLAFFLLVVFALSITPKVLFHEALAEHKDGFVCQDTDKSSPHIHQPAFHCSFDDLVVATPFVSIESKELAEPLVFNLQVAPELIPGTVSSHSLHQESRGPPKA